MAYEETEKVAWNLSISLLQEIGNLLKQSSSMVVNRKPAKSFECLLGVRLRVIQSLKDDERTELFNMEKKIKQYIILTREEIEDTRPDVYNKALRLLYDELDKYNTLLMDLLNKYGYLLQKKEDITRMSA